MQQESANARSEHARDVVLTAAGLGKTYPGGCKALDGVDIEVPRGEFIVILGRSGAGKSTLVRCMNRLLQPTEGRLMLEGQDITRVHGRRLRMVRATIGMIFQQFNLVSRLTVLENVLCGRLRYAGSPATFAANLLRRFGRNDRDAAFECLKQVGIERLALQRADQLSGGQQQRVAIARALAQEPHMLLADEPVASLDPRSARVVLDILRRAHEERSIPVVVNLHQVEFARTYAKRIIGMANGRIVFDDLPTRLTPDALETIYGREGDDSRAAGQALPDESPKVQQDAAPTVARTAA